MPRCNHQDQYADARRQRGVQRPSKTLGYAGIHQLVDIFTLMKIHVLSDPVIDDDRIVDGVTDDGQHHRHKRVIQRNRKDQERTQHDQHIVDQRDHRRYSRRKARKDGKPDPDIHRYQYRRQNHGDHGVVERLLPHIRLNRIRLRQGRRKAILIAV